MRPYRAGRRRSAIHRGMLLAALLLTGSLWIGVSGASAEVAISKSASATVSHVGENVHFTLTLTNTGALATTVTVRDTLPPNFTFVSVLFSNIQIAECSQGPVGTLTCTIALPASQSGTVVIVAMGDSPGPWSNQASVTEGTVTTDSNIVSGVILPRDIDGDGVADELDNCPRIANPGQTNTDGDAQGDACDADDDNDGVGDDADQCEGTTAGTTVAADGCADPDGDGISTNAGDNCPTDANPDQANTDGDAQGNACDTDDDNDNVADAADNCQFTANPNQQDLDGDGLGSACDTDELPTDKEQCRNGGWALFYDLDGPRFKNQGDCTSFVTRGPK